MTTGPEMGEQEMNRFQTKVLAEGRDAVAPDGSDVRILVCVRGGSMAHFSLGAHRISRAVRHRSVEEIWYFVSGRGEMWRRQDGFASVVEVFAGVSVTIPVGTEFQFRALGEEALAAVGVTMPAWPGDDEAELVEGVWEAAEG
jgi:mannose-6-phosphate isomerase-like protein (cupin superfamily)